MLTVSSAVKQLVAASDFAIEGLQSGRLNMSAYAGSIHEEIEALVMKPIQRASIVVALTRLAKHYQDELPQVSDFKLYNLLSRSGLTELTYPKSPQLQRDVAKLFAGSDIQSAPFCVATVGLGEISIITIDSLANSIKEKLGTHTPSLCLSGLSSLTMQVDIETIDTPRQAYAVIKQLALRNITIVEYITSPTELTIILYSRDLKESFGILHDRFFNRASRRYPA